MKRIRLASIVFAVAAFAAAILATSASATPVFSQAFAFGSDGTGENQFREISGIAADSSDNVWLTDTVQGKVKKWNSKGEFVSQFSAYKPTDIAIDSKGNLWISEWDKGVVTKYSPGGTELGHIGEYGEGPGQLIDPSAITIDSKGNFFVIEEFFGQRVEKFNSEGKYQSQFTLPFGTGKGQFVYAAGIAADSSGNLWITDDNEVARIQKWSPEGKYLSQVGEGYLGGPQGSPRFDSLGNLWIADSVGSGTLPGQRVDEFNPSGSPAAPINEFGKELPVPTDLAFDSKGNVFVTNPGNSTVEKWSAAPKAITTEANATTATLNGTVNPNGVETTYRFEYGTTGSYGTSVPVPDKAVGSGTSDVSVNQAVEGLLGSTTYHYRIVATNSYGSTFGEDKTFTTPVWTLPSNPKSSGAKWENLFGVSCTGSESCAATGFYESSSGVTGTLAKIKTAGKWSVTPTPNPEKATTSYLNDVSCTAANACTAVGGAEIGSTTTLAERWNGTGWSIQSTPNVAGAASSRLGGVSCVASNDCTAVGWSTSTGAAATLAEHWNGTTWTIVSTPNAAGYTKSYLYDVSCVSASDCWAVGMATNHAEPEASLAEHWDGSTWTVNSPAGSQNLNDIVCVSASSCLATTGRNMVLSRWNGSTWSQETAPKPEGATNAWLNGISCTSASACKAVGVWGTKQAQPLAESWNGSTWSVESTSEPAGALYEAALTKVSCTSTTACTSVGTYYPKGGPRWSLVEARH